MSAKATNLPYRERPLAPAPLPVLVGVLLFSLILLGGASRIENDWIAVFGGVAVLAAASFILDYFGRKEAEEHPNRLYTAQRLPSEKTRLKPAIIITTLILLIVFVTATTTPNTKPSPFPFFVATAFVYLLVPQILARRVVRQATIAKNS